MAYIKTVKWVRERTSFLFHQHARTSLEKGSAGLCNYCSSGDVFNQSLPRTGVTCLLD